VPQPAGWEREDRWRDGGGVVKAGRRPCAQEEREWVGVEGRDIWARGRRRNARIGGVAPDVGVRLGSRRYLI
jgi:hypothetical protein